MRLDHSSPVPLYHQAARMIEEMIADGRLPPGAKLDNELKMAEQLQVSRPTVRAALRELVDKGMLIRRRGIGTVVADVPITRPLALSSLHDDLIEAGRQPTTRVLRLASQIPREDVRETLKLAEGDRVYHIDRLRYADGEPIALMRNYIPSELVELSTAALEQSGLYELLRRAGIRVQIATQRIGAAAADPEQAGLLGIDTGDPLVTVVRTAFDTGGRPVELASHRYPAQSYSVQMTLVER